MTLYHKNEMGKPSEMDLPLLKNDITTIEKYQKPAIHSRYQRFGVDDFKLKSQSY